MRVLVCGDRNWTDRLALESALDVIHAQTPFSCVIEGEARGADSLARLWAESRGVLVRKYPALWETYGRAAGPIRNKQMLTDGQPELVIAFHKDIGSSKGTRNMLKQASDAGIPTQLIST